MDNKDNDAAEFRTEGPNQAIAFHSRDSAIGLPP